MSSSKTKYLKVSEVADILRCAPYTVTRLCNEGKIPAVKPAGQWLIPEAEFLDHVASTANQLGQAS